ncbi:hypothetical protein [Luteolibacter luteus]|uniref:Uncharacterized protein n=1 Tax=Luteolibacter luteus TaxID=2728835 RepID=A0A858RKY3_9BACT|nr:hypothetical protein [Luteolibacter luteus]QJE97986.1 hypothetical protein HHL09_20070 [Luteolibacter luteus]
MRRKPLYRSLTFWAGILMMAFICWAWWDSFTHATDASSGTYLLRNELAAIHLHHNSELAPALVGSSFSSSRKACPPDPNLELSLFPALAFARGSLQPGTDYDPWIITAPDETMTGWMHIRPPEDWLLVLPHWLILLAVALPWFLLLLWRARAALPGR